MRKREKLTPEERFSLALELVKRERSFEEICLHYQVSHTTAYKIRNAFLDGGRRALAGARGRIEADLEAGTARAAVSNGGSTPTVELPMLDGDHAEPARLAERDGDLAGAGLAASEPAADTESLRSDDAIESDYARR
jgi:transposase-like protein